jgi:hypothetical protein
MSQRHYAAEFFKQPDRFEDSCPVCNMTYVRAEPQDRLFHRSYHRDIVNVFEPKPSTTLAKQYGRHGQLVPVRQDSPQTLRRRLANISRVFKKEFGADFPMYEETGDPGDGYLVTEPDGRAIGGLVVRWIEFSNAPAQWTLSWVWIVPSHRRRGLMKSAWLIVRNKYPSIDPDPPFSKGAAQFFASRDDVSERVRRYAQGQLDADNFD